MNTSLKSASKFMHVARIFSWVRKYKPLKDLRKSIKVQIVYFTTLQTAVSHSET